MERANGTMEGAERRQIASALPSRLCKGLSVRVHDLESALDSFQRTGSYSGNCEYDHPEPMEAMANPLPCAHDGIAPLGKI